MQRMKSVGEWDDSPSMATRDLSVMALLAEAEVAGITLAAEADQLRIRGPKKAEVLGRLLLKRKEEVLAVLSSSEPRMAEMSPCPETSVTLPPTASNGAGWDDRRAATVVAEVDARIEAALLTALVADKPPRRNVLANDRAIVRRLARDRDPFLWQWPHALEHLLQRWVEWDTACGPC